MDHQSKQVKISWIFIFFTALSVQLFSQKTDQQHQAEPWLGLIALNDSVTLHVQMEVVQGSIPSVTLINGAEFIPLEATVLSADTIALNFPVYQSRLVIHVKQIPWRGYFEKTDIEGYRMPFSARPASSQDKNKKVPCCQLPARWKVDFKDNQRIIPAIGEFRLRNDSVFGSFITTAGDYRYLSGTMNGSQLELFGFDGGYVQVFRATLTNNVLRGQYWSGMKGYRTWVATPDELYALPGAEAISKINPLYDSISFSYPSIDGSFVSYQPSKYTGKVVVLQITGSWCPNCKDQAVFLQQLLNHYRPDQFTVLGIAFERMGTLEKSIEAAAKAKKDVGASYPVGVAQYSSRQKAEDVFPFLDAIRAYPTLIIIDKKGKVRTVYTGFAGPGTMAYEEVVQSLTQYIATYINE